MLEEKIKTEIARKNRASIVNLVQNLVLYAASLRASDIHIDPFTDYIRVRLRVDGMLSEKFRFHKEVYDEVISRIKILAGMRIDEHFIAQDGRFRMSLETEDNVDIRVSIMPTHYGENAVLRLLPTKIESLAFNSLGFADNERKKIEKALKKNAGMILATGPTGSGKTTTLYALVELLHTEERSIVTIEDPIERAISGIRQIQVNPRVGLTFSQSLRGILRQDPNVIMIGEIRDPETAAIAINISLTGHLIFSTLHTNDASSALVRLLNMGIEPYLIASTVSLVIAQRLVRKICQSCVSMRPITREEHQIIKNYSAISEEIIHFGKGCEKCSYSGFYGRVGVYEVLEIDEQIRRLILSRARAGEIKNVALASGMTTVFRDGFQKANRCITTYDEILGVSQI